MRVKSFSKFVSFFLIITMTIALIVTTLPIFSNAAEPHSLTLICTSSEVKMPDMNWNIYRVGERGENGSFKLTGDFADYPVSLANLSSASASQDAADTLENYAVIVSIACMNSGKTNSEGSITFSSIDSGLYLLSGSNKVIGDKLYDPSPILIEVSDSDEIFDMVSYPKIKVRELPSSSTVLYSVSKVWLNDEHYLQGRPKSIIVGLYRDGVFQEEITLNDLNNWTYTWMSDTMAEWRIVEVQVPEYYYVVYRANATQYVAVNTYDNTGTQDETTQFTTEDNTMDTSETETTVTETKTGTDKNNNPPKETGDSKKLPQTGQLWWPVPILLTGGLVLIVIGSKLRSKK